MVYIRTLQSCRIVETTCQWDWVIISDDISIATTNRDDPPYLNPHVTVHVLRSLYNDGFDAWYMHMLMVISASRLVVYPFIGHCIRAICQDKPEQSTKLGVMLTERHDGCVGTICTFHLHLCAYTIV
jgi:hypothetical protein